MTIMGMTAVIMLFVFLLGASVFSFVNVLIYRVPKQLPFGNERSFCPQCGQALKGYDMIPVFSYLLLGGKCRYCKCRISPRYPLIETLGGILAVWSVYYFGQSEMYSGKSMGQAVLVFLLLALLTAVTFVDIDTLEIPNGFVLAVLVLAVGAVFLFPE
ncbi:MAG: prepilin peptidase, partial [Lachnospiraceae bacterium]